MKTKTKVEQWIADGVPLVKRCNRCNTLRESAARCESCGCPEYTLSPKENAMSTTVMEPGQQTSGPMAPEAANPEDQGVTPEPEKDPMAELRTELEELREYQRRTDELRFEVEERAHALKDAKESVKNARALWEGASNRLIEYMADWRKDGDRPLFRQNKPKPPEPEAWRTLAIGELDLAESAAEKLGEAGIDTLGALSDKMRAGQRWWDDVQGIGENKAAKIADALADFWAKHPEYKAKDEPIPGKDAEVNDEDEEFPEDEFFDEEEDVE